MLGNFTYHNPTKLYFGKDAMNFLALELVQYGPRVMLIYGGGSIKRNGIYDKVVKVLSDCGKTVVEDPGVMPNPTYAKLLQGCKIAKDSDVDLILAVGGGSVVDYAKGVASSAWCEEDPWTHYWMNGRMPSCKTIPVGCVLTMVGTGSEMNGGSVITNTDKGLKVGANFGPENYPKFSILNPEFTYTVPRYQMVAGFYDIMSHIMEQYFSGTDDNTSDYMSEALMRSLVHSSRIAIKDPEDYEARSNIMWTATWALNDAIGCGKSQDWMVHMIGQAVGAHTDATHGMTLSAVSMAYYGMILPHAVEKFKRFAINVWDVSPDGKDDMKIAKEGLRCLEGWMKEIGVALGLKELGVTEEMIPDIADSTFIIETSYKTLTRDDVEKVLKESLK